MSNDWCIRGKRNIDTLFYGFKHIEIFQAWGELIVNANALIMHYFFQVIQGND